MKLYSHRHAKILRKRGRLPSAVNEQRRISEDHQDIILKMMNCSANSELFASRAVELKVLLDEQQELRGQKIGNNTRVEVLARRDSQYLESHALAFLDGPLLFHVFGSLSGALRDRLYELNLPLTEIRQLVSDLSGSTPGTLGQYSTTKDDAKARTDVILRWLDPSYCDQNSEDLSRKETEHCNTHEHCVNSVATTATTMSENFNATFAYALGQVLGGAVTQTKPQNPTHESEASQDPSKLRPHAQESPSESLAPENQPVRDQMSLHESIDSAARKEVDEKICEISTAELQRETTRRTKFLVDFQAYGILIQQLKGYREGGPHPNRNFIQELGMHDIRSCIYRLRLLWKRQSRAIQINDIEQLRLNTEVYAETAICLREAHCIMHMLLYYESKWWDVAEAGWNLDQMRELQAEMVPWAHEDPLVYTKLDVDAICQALQNVHDQHTFAQASRASKQQQKIVPLAKKRQVLPQVQKHVPAGGQGTVISNAVALPGHNGVAFEQMTNNLAAAEAALATIQDSDDLDSDDDMMDIGQYNNICPQFQSGKGCTLVDDFNFPCPSDHPHDLKLYFSCPYIHQGLDCPFGPIGCKFVHEVVDLPLEMQKVTRNLANQASGAQGAMPPQQHIQSILKQSAVPNADAHHYVLAENGIPLDSRNPDNICNNFVRNKCTGKGCRRIHLRNDIHSVLRPVKLQQNQPQAGRQTTQQPKACLHFSNGKCRYGNNCRDSHDPQVVFQQFNRYPPGAESRGGDIRMEDAASVGDGLFVRTQQAQERPCKWEQRGPCTNKKCNFLHRNPQSKQFNNEFQHPQQRNNQGGVQGGQRAPNDNTWHPSQGLQFAVPQNTHQVEQWASGVAQAHQQPQNACFTCGQPGHKANACPQRKPHNGDANSGGATNGSKICHLCGTVGHIAIHCPENRNHGVGRSGNNGGNNGGGRRGRNN